MSSSIEIQNRRHNSGMIRVLMVSLHADPDSAAGIGEGGGTHLYVRELMTELPRLGVQLTIVTRSADTSLPTFRHINENVKLYRVKIGPKGPLDKRWLDAHHEETVERILSVIDLIDSQLDLLHSIYWNSGKAVHAISIKTGIPYVHTVISNGIRRRIEGGSESFGVREEIERIVFQGASKIFCICRQEKADLVNLYGINEDKIVVVGRPIAKSFWSPAHDEFGQPRAAE